MISLRAVYHLARADFLERIRSYSFLIVILSTVLVAYLLVPADDAAYTVMRFSGYRGVYNSAWIGVMVAVPTSVFYSLAGFYVVKNTITRDLATGVGQIIAATPLSKILYVLGKFLSNFMVLAVGVAVLFVSAGVMQLIRGESYQLNLWALLSPFVYLALPVMVVIAAAAVLFESIAWLRQGFGNILFFFIWLNAIILPATSLQFFDLFGMNMVLPRIQADAAAHLGTPGVSAIILGTGEKAGAFLWPGVNWTGAMLVERLSWVGASLLILCAAAVFFNRFDPSQARASYTRVKKQPKTNQQEPLLAPTGVEANSLTAAVKGFSFPRLVLMELRLLLKGLRWWWYAAAAGFIAAPLLMGEIGQIRSLLAAAFVWPVLLLSQQGCREASCNTEQMIFSAPAVKGRQLPALWLAGVMVALIPAAGVVIRLAVLGHFDYLPVILAGAAFVSSLALALGVVSGGSKLFEVIYIVFFWYFGLLNGIPYLDFLGLSEEVRALVPPYYHLVAALLLFTAALLVRRRQVA